MLAAALVFWGVTLVSEVEGLRSLLLSEPEGEDAEGEVDL